jgi:basic amino acid/polyamine antiporter, APA family
VAAAGSISSAVAVGGFLYVGHFVPPLVALGILRSRDRGGGNPAFRTPVPLVLLPLALLACAVLLVTSGATGAAGGLGWLAVGLLLRRLAALRARRRRA